MPGADETSRPPSNGQVPITVVTATVQGWPEVAAAIRSHETAARLAGGRLIVADGSERPPPPPGTFGPETSWLPFVGLSVYQLRERACRIADGEIVAVTEDHCFVPGDWASRMVAAHRAHPDVSAIGGSLENGT